jgi:DNA-binding MarR family transcriptional regulator
MPLLDATGARPSTLAQRAGITKQAISQLARELEARGYVEQVPDSTDTRAKIVRLTKRGLALHAAAAEVRLELVQRVVQEGHLDLRVLFVQGFQSRIQAAAPDPQLRVISVILAK